MSKRNEVTRNGRSRRAAAIAIVIACMMTCTAFGADTAPQKSVLSAADAAAAGEQYTGEESGNTGGIELDIWESKTSSKKSRPCIIVSHDKNLKHKTGKKIKAYQLNWSNRGRYKIRKNARGLKKYGPQKVPTLNEAIACINTEAKRVGKDPNKYLIELDVKCKLSDRAVKEVIRLVGKRPVHILSSYQSNLLKFKKYRKYRTTECWYCSSTTSTKKRFKNIRFAGRHHYDDISIPYRYMNKKTIRLAKCYGMQIGGYNITSAAAVQKWVRAGCTRFNMRNKVFVR